MDGVLADFEGSVKTPGWDPPEMFEPGFYRNLKVFPNAKWAIAQLLMIPGLNIHIVTKHTTKVDHCASEKIGWIREHFPMLLRHMTITTDKTKFIGDYLIDDDRRWIGFKGRFLHFDKTKPEEEWVRLVHYFKTAYPIEPKAPSNGQAL